MTNRNVSSGKKELVRNFIFGVEDSLVSTAGLVSGVAAVGMASETVLLTGVVLIFVEAFSMAVGSLLSDNSARQFQVGRSVSLFKSVKGGGVMFLSYFFSGGLVILPYLFFSSANALPLSVGLTLLALFFLGMISAKLSKTSLLKNGLTMLLVGGVAVALGISVGVGFSNL